MRLRLQELQSKDKQVRKLRAEQPVKDGWEDINNVLHHQGLPYVSKIIRTELISRYHDNLLAGHFGIKKTHKLVAWKYYWLMLCHDVDDYIKGCDICLALKTVQYKPYGNLQSLPVPTYCWKNLLIDFVMGLPILTDWKRDSYDLILVIIDRLMKMIHYEPVKVTINTPGLAEVIINIVVRHHGLPDSIIIYRGSLFISKFWSLLCYFLGIKRKLSTAFYSQTDGQIKKQNSTMEAYLWAFVNFEQNDWAQLLLMAEFAYNNAKNASIGHTPFELNCRYHPWVSYKKDLDLCSNSKTAEELSSKLQNLMAVCQQNLHHAQEL